MADRAPLQWATKLNYNEGFKHLICIASGKGGVGKSTTAVNLSLALAAKSRVGLLDADIYGPSIPLMMGVDPGTRPEIRQEKYMVPVEAYGVQCNFYGVLSGSKNSDGMAGTHANFCV